MADEQDLLQIRDRPEWTPEERLSYLRDMILFEELARTDISAKMLWLVGPTPAKIGSSKLCVGQF